MTQISILEILFKHRQIYGNLLGMDRYFKRGTIFFSFYLSMFSVSVFLNLDPKTLSVLNSASKSMRDFLRDHFWGNKRVKSILRERLLDGQCDQIQLKNVSKNLAILQVGYPTKRIFDTCSRLSFLETLTPLRMKLVNVSFNGFVLKDWWGVNSNYYRRLTKKTIPNLPTLIWWTTN